MTGRLTGKIAGQENEVERPFPDKLGATMQGFNKTKLDETLKTAKVRVNSEEHRQEGQTPAEAYDRNQDKSYKIGQQETEEIEFCTPNSTIENLENYIIGKRIGQGAYAVVRLGLHRELNQKIAVKIYEKLKLIEPNRRKSVKREMKIMEKLDHPNIAKLYEAFESPKQVFLIMEYVNGGSLHGYLKMKPNRQMPELEAKFLWR
jgi:serine/threonine protein kinase